MFDDVNDIWSHWENLLKQAIDNGTPSKLACVKGNRLLWIKHTIEKQIRFRNHFMGNSTDPRRVTIGTTIVFSEPRSQF